MNTYVKHCWSNKCLLRKTDRTISSTRKNCFSFILTNPTWNISFFVNFVYAVACVSMRWWHVLLQHFHFEQGKAISLPAKVFWHDPNQQINTTYIQAFATKDRKNQRPDCLTVSLSLRQFSKITFPCIISYSVCLLFCCFAVLLPPDRNDIENWRTTQT